MNNESKTKAIAECLNNKDYSKAIELTNKYFSDNSNHDTMITNIQLCKKYNVNNISIAQQKKDKEEFYKNVSITNMENQQKSYGNYFDACITIENANSTPISYIELNINIYDNDGNLINTAMTNDTNIQGNSKRIITKMLPYGEGSWSAEITKITRG